MATPKPQSAPAVAEPSTPPVADEPAVEPEPLPQPPSPVSVTEPEPASVSEPEPASQRLDPERALAVLEDALDTLGSAHHRPFSRG